MKTKRILIEDIPGIETKILENTADSCYNT